MIKKVLFIHDGPRWKDASGIQFGTSVDICMFERYQYLGEEVCFMMRVFERSDTENLFNLNDKGLHIIEVPPFNRPHLLKNYRKSKLIIQESIQKFDILVIRLPSTIGSIAVALAEKLNIPYLIEVVACPWDSLTNHSLLGKLYAPVSKKKLSNLVRKAPFVMYVTEVFLQNRYPNDYKNIGVSDVMLNVIPEDQIEKKMKHYAKFDGDDKPRLRLGTLAVVDLPYKGHDIVLKAIKRLKKSGFELDYKIAGNGDFSQLSMLIERYELQNNVHYIGVLDHKEVFNFLRDIDVYVQPSRTEGMPRALIEAMSMGCACIGSNAGGIPELLQEEAIFPSKNVKALVEKLKAFNNKNLLIEQCKVNFIRAKDYQFYKLEQKRHAFYDTFLNSIDGK
ncbi:glycosyltransferase family 4 protein [Cyclobacterium sp. SYSU L10401]|uniref:glycosyltransferase family 4 protein n=1 Tax=Cyclobacterium sp. SYSU L10401 TaxID=2678657 RepID=UPI0013D7F55C|nr:glycosyltransferase family 4 protein [Cyclobacterium sp. SYSU L10401]